VSTSSNAFPTRLTLTAAIGRYGNTSSLLDGRVTDRRLALRFGQKGTILQNIRDVCRGALDVDICELPLCTYLLARSRGLAMTAVPVFVVRRLPLGVLCGSLRNGVREPADLAGGRIGARSYTDTTSVWLRGMLCRQYGIALDDLRWLLCDEEHVASFVPPPNVTVDIGADLPGLLDLGRLDATVKFPGRAAGSWAAVFPDPGHGTRRWIDATGAYPLSHTIAVRERVLHEHPWVAEAIFDLVSSSTADFLAGNSTPTSLPDWEQEICGFSQDPLPHGLEANRTALRTLVEMSVEQGIIPGPVRLEDLFVPIG
jgi:4,5-dihydroxyphthalate decarboxylase